LLSRIRENADRPLCVRCPSEDVFAYQAPGPGTDGPGGPALNAWRDVDVLRRLNLAPGVILSARVLLKLVMNAIPSIADLCGDPAAEAEAWRGCPHSRNDAYECGREKGIDALIPPRSKADMARDKAASLRDMLVAGSIPVRPHILLCAVAQYGNGVRPPFKPDNLPEMLRHVLVHPETPITLVPGADWMMCAPCPSRVAACNACTVGAIGSGGLYNELKDWNVLKALGLTYGDTLPGREMFARIFERVPSVAGVCALDRSIPEGSLWRDACGAGDAPCPGYARGREALMREMKLPGEQR
jgi:hypothetical protein